MLASTPADTMCFQTAVAPPLPYPPYYAHAHAHAHATHYHQYAPVAPPPPQQHPHHPHDYAYAPSAYAPPPNHSAHAYPPAPYPYQHPAAAPAAPTASAVPLLPPPQPAKRPAKPVRAPRARLQNANPTPPPQHTHPRPPLPSRDSLTSTVTTGSTVASSALAASTAAATSVLDESDRAAHQHAPASQSRSCNDASVGGMSDSALVAAVGAAIHRLQAVSAQNVDPAHWSSPVSSADSLSPFASPLSAASPLTLGGALRRSATFATAPRPSPMVGLGAFQSPIGTVSSLTSTPVSGASQYTPMQASQQPGPRRAASAPLSPTHATFTSTSPPDLSIPLYLSRLLRHAQCSPAVLPTLLVLLRRALAAPAAPALTTLTVHRLVAAAFLAAVKMVDDRVYSLKFYARVTGVSGFSELVRLERTFLQLTNFKLLVSQQEFDATVDVLKRVAALGVAREI